ncbi:MAG: amidase family protein [Candidatus Nanoarchaeia archaeon]
MDIKQEVIDEVEKIDKEFNYLNVICNLENRKKGRLSGVSISVKDAICVKGVESTAGSAILNGYKPVFNATVIERCLDEGATIVGKTAQDEFGFGSFCTNVGKGFKVPKNPFDKERCCGGSSGGCAGLTQKMTSHHISLAESTGGSIVTPASFCGVYGLCPTYGRVSRYGLMDYANSLDKIGPMAKDIKDVALLLEIISGFDRNESTCTDVPVDKYTDFVGKDIKRMKIGIIKEGFGEGVSYEVAENVRSAIKRLEDAGATVEEVTLPLTMKYGLSAYYLISTSEASTNLARYCGMRYGASEKLEGNFNEYFSKVRSKYLGDEVKRRILIGTFARMAGYRDAYYIKALKVRTKIIEEYKNLFRKFDALISPTVPVLPPKFSEINRMTPLQEWLMDILTVGPNLAGLPHLNIPSGTADGLPVGTLLIADHFQEGKLIQIGSQI